MKLIDPCTIVLDNVSAKFDYVEFSDPAGVNMYAPNPEWNAHEELKKIETAARTCYKSEAKMTSDPSSAHRLIRKLIENGHEAMLEHSLLTVKFICSRAISHELVRHRMASFAQESQRYCNYSKDDFGHDITFIRPLWWWDDEMNRNMLETSMMCAEENYFDLLDRGLTCQEAREVLPNCTKTEVVISANYREWRHILQLRCSDAAHPEMRRLMRPLLAELKSKIPVVFDDITY